MDKGEDFRSKENLVPCPYNESHMILQYRMSKHLIKCKQSYPNVVLKICPFNRTHQMQQKDFNSHMFMCPDKEKFDREKYVFANDMAKEYVPPISDNSNVDIDEEVWDTDEVVSSFNPLEKSVFIYKTMIPPNALGKSGRNKWHSLDSARRERLSTGQPAQDIIRAMRDLAPFHLKFSDAFNKNLDTQADRLENQSQMPPGLTFGSRSNSLQNVTSQQVMMSVPLRRPILGMDSLSQDVGNITLAENGVKPIAETSGLGLGRGLGRGLTVAPSGYLPGPRKTRNEERY